MDDMYLLKDNKMKNNMFSMRFYFFFWLKKFFFFDLKMSIGMYMCIGNGIMNIK